MADDYQQMSREELIAELERLRCDRGGELDPAHAALRREISERRAAEEQLQKLNETLEHRVAERTAVAEQRAEQLRGMALSLTQAERQQRRRLAQILHDHLQQLLVGAKMQVSMLGDAIAESEVQLRLQRIGEVIGQAIEASRSLTVELCPPMLHEAGLARTLEWLASTMQEKHELQVETTVDEQANPASEEICTLLFEAVRELLFNVIKHAGVRSARVVLRNLADDRVEIVVEDHGRGFDPVSRLQEGAGTGFGLFGIRERLLMLDGQVEIVGQPGIGTRITLVAPRSALSAPEAAYASGPAG